MLLNYALGKFCIIWLNYHNIHLVCNICIIKFQQRWKVIVLYVVYVHVTEYTSTTICTYTRNTVSLYSSMLQDCLGNTLPELQKGTTTNVYKVRQITWVGGGNDKKLYMSRSCLSAVGYLCEILKNILLTKL